jgi:hypothetical protein
MKYLCTKDYFEIFKKGNIYDLKNLDNIQEREFMRLTDTEVSIYFKPLDNEINTPSHYDNSKGSLYQFAEQQGLNAWEFDILKRTVRCRKKGNFEEDIKKTIAVLQLYLKEYEQPTKD